MSDEKIVEIDGIEFFLFSILADLVGSVERTEITNASTNQLSELMKNEKLFNIFDNIAESKRIKEGINTVGFTIYLSCKALTIHLIKSGFKVSELSF